MYTNSLRKVLTGFCRKIRQKFSPMTDKQYYKEMEKAREFTKDKRRRIKIETVRNQWKEDIEDAKEKREQKTKKKFEFSKVIVVFVFIMCMEILIFSQYLLWDTKDTSALYSLIAIPSTLIPTILAYYNKSKMENTIKLNNFAKYDNMNQDNNEDNRNDENTNDININIPEPQDITCEPISVTELTGTNESGGKG